MTYGQLLNALSALPPRLLSQKVKLYEGCSGNWDTIISVEVADEDEWREEDYKHRGI